VLKKAHRVNLSVQVKKGAPSRQGRFANHDPAPCGAHVNNAIRVHAAYYKLAIARIAFTEGLGQIHAMDRIFLIQLAGSQNVRSKRSN
jgi:hypothetical protein